MPLDNNRSDIDEADSIDEVPIISDLPNQFIHETEGQIADCVASLSQLPEIQPDRWEGLGEQERINVLQEVENRIANIQGRPSVEIVAQEMEENEFGAWDGSSIVVNLDHVNGDQTVMENLDTVIHEGRHAFQDYAINNPEIVGDDEIVNQWVENSENYLDIQTYGPELYFSQPLEQDAWSYGSSITENIYREGDKT